MSGIGKAIGLALSAAAAGWGLASCTAAVAQNLVQPPVLSSIDANGVNLADGKYQLPGASVSIGTSSNGLQRSVVEGGADNWANDGAVAPNGSSMVLSLSLMGKTYIFPVGTFNGAVATIANGPYSALGSANTTLTCSGPTITGPCTLYLPDGSQAVYISSVHTPSSNYGVLQSVTFPSGEKIAETYWTDSSGYARSVKTVTSTKGWELWYTVDGSYDVTQVTAFNMATAWCDPNGSSCSPGSSYPYATDSISGTTHSLGRNGTALGTYTVSGGTTTLTSPAGVVTTVVSNTSGTYNGRVSTVTRGGSSWTYSYATDGSGNITTTVGDPVTSSTYAYHSLTVSPLGQILSNTDDVGRTTKYTYNANGLVSQAISPDATFSGTIPTGGYAAYAYNAYGMPLTSTTYPKGGGTPIVTSEAYGNVCTLSGGIVTNAAVCNKPTSTTDANGVVTTYTYDSYGDLISSTLPAQTNGVHPATGTLYSAITPYIYTTNGSTTTAQTPIMMAVSTASCMTSSLSVTSTALSCSGGVSDERLTTATYNTSNILSTSTKTSLGDGSLPQMTTTTYNTNGQVIVTQGVKQTGADETYYFYDALGRQIGIVGVDPDGSGGPRHRQATTTYYDGDGHTKEVDTGIVGTGTSDTYSGGDAPTRNGQAYSDWTAMTSTSGLVQNRTVNEFDGYGRLIITADYIGSATTPKDAVQTYYDTMQRVQCAASRLNASDYAGDFSNLKSLAACTLGTTGSDGSHDRITNYTYDNLNNVTSSVSAFHTLSARTDFAKQYDITTSTATGTLTYAEDANGNRTTYIYDNFDRLIKTCMPLTGTAHISSTTDCSQTAYRTTSVTGAIQVGTIPDHGTLRDGIVNSYGYDAVGRVNTVSSSNGGETQGFTYDNFNDVITHSTSTLGTTGTEMEVYNALGWMMSDVQVVGTVTYGYDAYGRRNLLTYPGGFSVGYNYTAGDELSSMSIGGVNQAAFDYDDYGHRWHLYRGNGQTTTYTYDASTLRLGSIGHPANTQTFTYNAADQIVLATNSNSTFSYTPSAKSTAYNIDGQNRLASVVGGASFNYDGHGNLAGDGSGSTYTYNADNMLTSATLSSVTTSLTYDSQNRLIKTSQAGGLITQFLYDGTDLIAEYDGSGNLLKRYVHGPGDDEPLVMFDTSGNAYYYGADQLGSVTVTTYGPTGAYTVNTYDEYGMPSAGNTGRFQYTGQTWLPEIKMYYYKARLYSPILGRFMQADPIGYGDSMNSYAYVNDDPVDSYDPTGEDPCGSGQSCPTQVVVTACGSLDCILSHLGSDVVSKLVALDQSYISTLNITNYLPSLTGVQTNQNSNVVFAQRGSGNKGERKRTGKASGTPNPDKKFKPGKKPGTRETEDQNGKGVTKPWPQDPRLGGDGTGVKPGTKLPDGTPVYPPKDSGSSNMNIDPDDVNRGIVIGGAGVVGLIIVQTIVEVAE